MSTKTEKKLDDLFERIDKSHELFHAHSLQDAENFTSIKSQLSSMKDTLTTHLEDMKQYMEAMEPRVRGLEDFRLKFVAKFSVLSAVAITIGSVLGQLAITAIHQVFFK